MDTHYRYQGNQYVNSQGKLVRFKGEVDLFSRQGGRESYLQFVVKKWMKLLDQKDIKGKVCIHDIDMVLEVTDGETMKMWLHELAGKHNIPPDKMREHITKPCYPVEKFLRNDEEFNKMPPFISRCSSVAESSWFEKYYWELDYVVQGKIVKGKGTPRTKPYSKEENRENWKITKMLQKYEEHFGHKPGSMMAPGIPYSIRPEGMTGPRDYPDDD